MGIQLTWRQLELFPENRALPRYCQVDDFERDQRTGGQWLRAIESYLRFRSGDSWRRLSDPAQRFSPDRLWYIDGIRTLNGFNRAPDRAVESLTAFTPAPIPADPRLSTLAGEPRLVLVTRLMAADPSLTDKKLLLHLSRPKLARMLCRALDARPAELERSA